MSKMDINSLKQTIIEKIDLDELKARVLETGVKFMSHPMVQKALGHPLVGKAMEKAMSTRDKLVRTYELWTEKE